MWFMSEAAMAAKLRWERARLDNKPKSSIKDEKEFRARDLAQRWLEQAEQRRLEWEQRCQRIRQRRENKRLRGKRNKGAGERPPWE